MSNESCPVCDRSAEHCDRFRVFPWARLSDVKDEPWSSVHTHVQECEAHAVDWMAEALRRRKEHEQVCEALGQSAGTPTAELTELISRILQSDAGASHALFRVAAALGVPEEEVEAHIEKILPLQIKLSALDDRRTLESPNIVERALAYAVRYGGIDGDHHKAWVIDQIIRALTGCPIVDSINPHAHGGPQAIRVQGESATYKQLVVEATAGEDGPNTYSWNTGVAP